MALVSPNRIKKANEILPEVPAKKQNQKGLNELADLKSAGQRNALCYHQNIPP